MPRIPPPGGAVDWSASEGVLGVVGVAPWATLDFCRILYSQVRAAKDWHYPRVLLDINTKIPSRGRHLQLHEADPSPAIAATIDELALSGATLAVVVCNTAHVLYDRWGRGAAIPVLHIIEETVRAARLLGAHRVAPLVSASLAAHDLYGLEVVAQGLSPVRLTQPDQHTVESVIENVKVCGRLGSGHEFDIAGVLERLRALQVDTVVAGCTELSGLEEHCTRAGLRFVDSNAALARAALSRIGVAPESSATL